MSTQTEIQYLNRSDLIEHLDPQEILTLRLLHLSLFFFPLLVLGAVFFLHQQAVPAELENMAHTTDESLLFLLAVCIPLPWIASPIVTGKILSPAQIQQRFLSITSTGDLVVKAMQLLRTTLIIRGALFEAASLLGLVILLLAAHSGLSRSQPAIWLACLPMLVQAAYVIVRFPDRSSLADAMVAKILKPLQQEGPS